jgi:hypothetical protein
MDDMPWWRASVKWMHQMLQKEAVSASAGTYDGMGKAVDIRDVS